jgi:signal transduction histidine kinase
VGDLVISINGMLGALSQAKTNLIESSRLAGITEITTSILHNVGNVLNSINVSAMAIHEEVDRSRLLKLKQVYEMLDVNKQDLNYLNTNDQGKILLPYLDALISHLQAEQGKIKNELSRLINNLNHVNNIIALQQSSVKQHAVEERIVMSQLLEDVLTMFSAKIKTSNINIERSYADIPAIKSVKAKIHQIMANLIKNAIESLSEVGHTDRLLIIKMAEVDENFIQVSISDNGIGISAENLTSIFSFGFTTKSQGHGYGLHNCALLAKELGGKLLAESKGIDLGAAFILEIPIIHPKKTVPISLTLKQPDSKAPVTP